MGKEFLGFLKQYGVIGLAIAVIIGGKLNAVVTSLVEGLLMPLIGLIPVGGGWETWGFDIQDQKFMIGPIISALINFLVVAWIVFVFAKKVLREETVTKK